jgi:hypothetical protein
VPQILWYLVWRCRPLKRGWTRKPFVIDRWDKTLVPDPLGWTLEQFKSGKLRDMIQRAGYPGVAADYDQDVVNALMPGLEQRARAMDAQPLPAEPTPNMVPR